MCCVVSTVLPVRDLGGDAGEMLPQLGCDTLQFLHLIAMIVPITQWA